MEGELFDPDSKRKIVYIHLEPSTRSFLPIALAFAFDVVTGGF